MASFGGGVGLDSGDGGTDILREFFDFDEDLIMPDKPFTIKKEQGSNQSDLFFGQGDDQDDFFMGATPSPSSSSTASTSSTGVSGQPTKKPASPTLELAMSMANDFMNIDFSAAADVDVNSLDDDLDFMHDYQQTGFSGGQITKIEKEKCKNLNEATFMEGICVHTDLGSPLKTVRRKLEKRFSVDLTDYTFWLQDSSKLDDKSALSEQCIEGTGIVKVQLNIQPYNDDNTKKINIIDVLKVEQSTDSSDEFSSCDDESEIDVVDEPEVAPSEERFKPVTNFLESTDFSQMKLRDKFPSSIRDWSKFHTIQWVRWVNRTFKGVRLVEEKWRLDGSDFSTLSKSEFGLRAGSDPGNNLWSHYTYLKESGIGMVPLDLENITSSSHFNFQSIAAPKRPYDSLSPASRAAESVTQYPKKQRVILGKYEEGKVFINSDDTSNVHRTGNNGTNVQLWRFLLDILTDYRHRSIIRWSLGEGCSEGEFVMVEPEGVARLWGQQKGKVTMNYEKLSRALRYYKGGNILDKVHNKKFTYRFVCDLRDIVGYSAYDLQRQVKDQAERSIRS